jgi:demethylmenaquinone methyltransferase/2-methoxy-6-polyprenyl-1,4-benzoquinol methylase
MVELRGDEKRRYVGEMFTRISPRYDLMNAVMTFGMDRRWRRVAARQAMKGLEGVALDVATGTGDLALELARTRGVTSVVGVDLLETMVARAARKQARKRTRVPVDFMVGDALSLPFPDGAFACVTSAFALRNVPDLEGALAEMMRVVRPGGRVLSLETLPAQGGIFKPMVRLYFNTAVPFLGSLVAGDGAAYRYLSKSMGKFLSSAALEKTYRDLGFREVGRRPLAMGSVHLHWGVKG